MFARDYRRYAPVPDRRLRFQNRQSLGAIKLRPSTKRAVQLFSRLPRVPFLSAEMTLFQRSNITILIISNHFNCQNTANTANLANFLITVIIRIQLILI